MVTSLTPGFSPLLDGFQYFSTVVPVVVSTVRTPEDRVTKRVTRYYTSTIRKKRG